VAFARVRDVLIQLSQLLFVLIAVSEHLRLQIGRQVGGAELRADRLGQGIQPLLNSATAASNRADLPSISRTSPLSTARLGSLPLSRVRKTQRCGDRTGPRRDSSDDRPEGHRKPPGAS